MIGTSVSFLRHPYNLYYECLRPGSPTSKPPLLLVHGGAQTGACFRATPDGRVGWADRFVDAGFPVVVADWPGCGRSGYVPLDRIDYDFLAEAFEALVRQLGGGLVVLTHSMSGPIGWKLLESAGDQVEMVVGIAPAPPGNIQPVAALGGADPAAGEIVEEREDLIHLRFRGVDLRVDLSRPFTDTAEYMKRGAIGLSTRYPGGDWRPFATSYPPRVLLQRLNLRGSALSLDAQTDLTGARALIVTGTADTNHARGDDEQIARFLRERGASVEFVWLGDHGFHGNGHMLMWEDNSLEIADLISRRIVATLRGA